MKTTISKSDFSFYSSGHGHYKVVYTSPATGKNWATITSDMQIIDSTKNADEPKKVDLMILKRMCKSN